MNEPNMSQEEHPRNNAKMQLDHMPSSNSEATSSIVESHSDSTAAEALSTCLLSQYRLCAGGVLAGAAYGIKYRKGIMPMVAAGISGTVADLIYGYLESCKNEVEAYKKEASRN